MLKVILFGVVILFMTIVGIFLLYLSNTEALAIVTFETETGLKFPEQYTVLSKSGSWQRNRISIAIKIDSTDYQELIDEIQKSPLYNDSIYLTEYFGLSPEFHKTKGMWMDHDSVFYYLNLRSTINNSLIRKENRIIEFDLSPY